GLLRSMSRIRCPDHFNCWTKLSMLELTSPTPQKCIQCHNEPKLKGRVRSTLAVGHYENANCCWYSVQDQ
ncbi:hypothetical protein ACH5RR_018171, partial [Cinchona calisaya]